MAEKCLRNASCKCSMCAGFDVASLMSISKSITSNIQYDDTEEASEAPPVSKMGGGVANSPPLSTKKTFVSNSPPLQPVQSQIEAVSMDLEAHDVNMVEVASVQATVDTSGPSSSHDPQLDTSEPLDDMQVDTVASTLSDMEVDSAGPSPCVSLDTVLPQLTDKNWKVRKEAYEALKRVFEQPEATTSQVQAVLELFPKLCEDSNASAMEAGFAAVLAYTLNVEPFEKEIVPAVMARVTDKGFSARPGIVKLCEELTDAFVAAGAADETTVALLEGTANRKPKVPPACLSCLLEALKAYGPRVLPLQRIKNALPKLMEGPVKARPIAMSIMVEIHRWTGPALLQDVVATLRPAQQTDFEGRVKDVVPGQAVPVKFIRGAKAAKATAGTAHGKPSGGSNESVAPAAAAIDPRDFVETVDLLAKLPKTDFKAKLALPKWSEKVEALKIVLDLIGPVPKLANGDYYDLVATLKALTNDSNVNIVAKAIEVFGALADGLRKNFIQTARMIFPELLRKLSDKKTVILSATNHTLDVLVQHVMPLELMMEDLKLACDATKNKAPPARVQTIAFLTRAVEKRYVELTDKTVVTFLATMFQKGVDDTDPKVREAGQVAFVALLKASNETSKWLQPMINDMASKNPRAFKAIQRGIGGTGALTPSSRASSAPPSRPSSASSATSRSSIGAATKVAELDGVVDVDMADAAATPAPARARVSSLKKKAGPPAGRFGMKQPPAAAGNVGAKAVAGKSAGVSAGGGGSTDFTPVAISVSIEEAENILADLELASWAAIQDGFKSTKWMERKAAIEKLQEYAKTHASAMTMRVIEAFTMYLANQVKDFKDSNINVLKSSFEAVGTFAAHAAGKFPRGVVCHVVPRACDKIGDKKANKAVRDMLLSFCEATSPSYTTGCMMEYMPKVRLPLAHIEALVVFLECVQDFGVSICNPRALIDYAKGPLGLESSNPKVRGAAISLLGGMYSQLGPALLPILNLDSWKPALAETVKAEFQKAGYDPASALASVKRQVKNEDEDSKTTVDSGALFGRVDISSQLTKELFEKLKNEADKGAWKKRGEAMDTVQAICEAAGCAIEFTRPVQEVVRMLKARLSDSNANLKVKAANVLAVVATSVGPEIAKMSKILGVTLIAGVADNKKAMQAAALQALHKWVRHGGKTSAVCVESLLVPLAEGLGNTVGRAELLGWAVEHVKNCEKLDLHGLVVPTVHCMMDKSSEAREKAQQLLVEVMKSVGKETVLSTGCRDVKPAAMRALKPLLAKVCEAAEANGPESSVPAAVPGLSTTSASSRVAPSTIGNGEAGRSGIRRRASISAGSGTPVKSRLARPGSLKPSISSTSLVEKTEKEATPLLKMSFNKAARLSRGQSNRWIFEATSLSETNMRKSELEAEWKPFLSPEFHATLFAPSLEKGMLAAMDQLTLCIVHQADEVIASLDLVLKWCTLRMVDNNVQALAKLLEVLIKLVELLKTRQYQLDDVEAAIVLPYLLQESGQSKPRFRVRFRDVMKLVVDVYTPEKYVPYLMECFNNSKNMKSRCECIDLVEYIVTGHGYHVVGRKCIKDVAKYVVAHEKELRESALSTLVAVYTIRSDRDQVDKFFRFAGITTQQGMDLVSARLKHLPSTSSNVGTEASSEEGAQAPLSLSQRSRRSGFGFGFGRASTVVPPPTPTLSGSTKETGEKSTLQMEKKALNTAPGDEDVDMNAPQDDVGEETMSPSQSIEDLLLRPIELLIDSSSKEVVSAGTQAYKEGGNALKGLYAIIHRPSDPSEVAFLHSYVNEIVLALCDCIHGAFYAGNAEKRPEMYILAMSLTTLTVVFNSEGVTSLQRYTVERVVLELCSKMLDPRLEKVAQQAHVPVAELQLTPEDNRYLMVYKALYKALRKVTEKAKPGDVYTSVINLLQRLMHNDVGEYNKNDALKHLLKEDSLDQLVGRMLLKLSTMQAQLLTPFEGIDVAGVLMQMHGFFATLPRAEVMMVDIANDNMQAALRILAESLWKTRSSVLEAAMKDIPSTSVVRQLVHEMESNVGQGQEAAEPTGWQHTGDKKKETTTMRSAAMKPVSTVTESLSRRLFPPKDTGRGIAATMSSSLTVNGGGPVATRGRSFTSFHDFTAHRSATTTTSRPSTTSEQLESLRERLQQSRHFK